MAYKEQPTITARNIREAGERAKALYPDETMHVLVDRTDDPTIFRVQTKGGWTPKPGDSALYLNSIRVTVRTDLGDGLFEVQYAENDPFGERASFTADRLELRKEA